MKNGKLLIEKKTGRVHRLALSRALFFRLLSAFSHPFYVTDLLKKPIVSQGDGGRGHLKGSRGQQKGMERTVKRSTSVQSNNSGGIGVGNGNGGFVMRPRERIQTPESKHGEDDERIGDDIEMATYRAGSSVSDSGSEDGEGGEEYGEDGREDGARNGEYLSHEDKEGVLGTVVRIWRGPARTADRVDDFSRYGSVVRVVNRLPAVLRHRVGRTARMVVLAVYFTALLLTFRTMYGKMLFDTPLVDGRPLQTFPCGATKKLWLGTNDKCGLDARKCLRPFRRHETLYVRCPAFCGGSGLAYDVVKYADQEVQYEPYIVKSPVGTERAPIYRADSFPCIAAYEQGAISQLFGGPMAIQLNDDFPYDAEEDEAEPRKQGRHGLFFNSEFPASFTISQLTRAAGTLHNVYDLKLYGILVGVVYTVVVAVIGWDARIFYFTSVGIVYTTIVLCSDPPVTVEYLDNQYGGGESAWRLLSVYVERMIPLGLSVGFVWKCVGEYTFGDDKVGSIQRLVFLLGCWVTGLDNLTFERLPIDRLLLGDVLKHTGSVLAFLFIVGLILCCAVVQSFKIWRAGWFRQAFVWYVGGLVLLVWVGRGCSGLLQLPLDGGSGEDAVDVDINVNALVLRIHHWVIGMALIYACKTRWVGSYLMQGLCLGLVLDGVGRWGFASVLEQHASVQRDRDSVHGHLGRPRGVRYDRTTGVAQVLFADSDRHKILLTASQAEDKKIPHDDDDGDAATTTLVFINGREALVKLLVNDVLVYAGPASSVPVSPLPGDMYLRAAVCYDASSPEDEDRDEDDDPNGDDNDNDNDVRHDGALQGTAFRCSGWSAAMRY